MYVCVLYICKCFRSISTLFPMKSETLQWCCWWQQCDCRSSCQRAPADNMTSSRLGMRRLRCVSERWTYNYQALADDDQKTLSCIASVSGLRPVVRSVRLDVDCTYHFVCLSVCLFTSQSVSTTVALATTTSTHLQIEMATETIRV